MKLLAPLVFAAVLASPAHANTPDLYGKDFSVDCAPRDRACLLETATDMIYIYAQARENPRDKGFTNTLAKIHWMLPDTERAAFVTRLEDFDAQDPADLMFDFKDYLDRNKPLVPVDLAVLEQVLQTQQTPDGSKFGDFILDGFASLMNTDQRQAAQDLWMQERDVIWRKGQRTYQYMQRWLAQNDPQGFRDHTRSFNIAGRAKVRVLEVLSVIAQNHCQRGNLEDGRNVLSPMLQQFGEIKHNDPSAVGYHKAQMYRAVLECEDEDFATSFLQEIYASKDASIDAAKDYYTDPAEAAAVINFIGEKVEFATNRVLATKLYQQGRIDEARKVFEDGQATVGVFGTTITDDGTIALTPSLDRAPMRWETFTYDADRAFAYSHGSVAIPFFMNTYDFDVTAKFFPRDDFEYFIEAIGDVWPSQLGQEGAEKIASIADDLKKAQREKYNHFPDATRLKLGLYAQPPECTYSDETLKAMLDGIPDYKYNDQKFGFILSYVRYLDRTEAAEPTDGDGMCLLDQT